MEGMGGLKITIVGLGFVGLTTALGFADKGFQVKGYDISKERTRAIKDGYIPFYEPELDYALMRNLGNKFSISESVLDAAVNPDICFFCVGTPSLTDGSADLSYLFSSLDSILDTIPETCVIVIKSTVPPGTLNERIVPYIRNKGVNNPVAANPEFLREGKCWEDFMYPGRIVCGVNDSFSQNMLTTLYAPFDAPIYFVEPNTAEFIKYLSNSLLATLISYSNEMSLIANAIGGIDISKAFKILHTDKRLNGSGIRHYIYPGCGFGGYCLPKDTYALAACAKASGYGAYILDAVISLNTDMPCKSAENIEHLVESKDNKIGILGLSFKPDSDDVRDSPAAKIISRLIEDGYSNIYAYDPLATESFCEAFGLNITYCESKEDVCDICDTVAVVTVWDEFQGIHKKYPQNKWYDCRYWLER